MFTQGVLAVSNNVVFTQENQLEQKQSVINDFWQQGDFSHFNGVKNKQIYYASFSNTDHKKCLFIVSGRSETYLKFKELAYDFFQQGFNIYLLDHRGQGLSERLLSNKYKGYVADFDDYADDLHTFVSKITQTNCQNKSLPSYLLAHSMGGAIAVRYLQKYPNVLTAVVLSSPMIAFNDGGLPNWLSHTVIKTVNQLNQWFAKPSWYFFGQGDFQLAEFANNPLSHSEVRFGYFTDLYKNTAKIQLGGVTVHWLQQAIKTTQAIFADIDKITTPTLVIQSGSDTIVDNNAQNEFCAQLHKLQPQSCPSGKVVVIAGAKHELFLESDRYRNIALSKVLTWFNQHH